MNICRKCRYGKNTRSPYQSYRKCKHPENRNPRDFDPVSGRLAHYVTFYKEQDFTADKYPEAHKMNPEGKCDRYEKKTTQLLWKSIFGLVMY